VTSETPIRALRSAADLDHALERSRTRPLLIFKNSLTCGTSAVAFDELHDHLAEGPREVDYAIVTVQTDREVSNAVAARLHVRHETPQVLLVRDGRVEWSVTHHRVTADELSRALARWPVQPPRLTTTPTGS